LGEAFVITLDVLNDVLSGLYDFNNGIDEAGSKTNGLTKVLQAFNVAIGFVSDGFKEFKLLQIYSLELFMIWQPLGCS
jgi:hypothetical protein